MKIKGLKTRIHTTGLNLTKRKLNLLKKNIESLGLTLDGSNSTKVYFMRENLKLFNKTLDIIEYCNKIHLPVSIKTIVTKVNQEDLPKIAEIISKFKITRWMLFEFIPLNKAELYKNRFYITYQNYTKIMNTLKKDYPSLKIISCPKDKIPRDYCFINVLGEIFTHNKKKGDIKIGDLRNERLKEIIERNHL